MEIAGFHRISQAKRSQSDGTLESVKHRRSNTRKSVETLR